MNSLKKLVPFLIFLSFESGAATYSFDQALELLIKNNSQLISAQENLNAAITEKKASYSNFLPKVNASLSYSKSEVEPLDASESYAASLNGTLNLFNGFASSATLEQAEGRVMVAQANLQSVKAQLSYDLKNSFANLTFGKDSLVLAENILKRRSENLAMIELRFQNGRENKGSVLLAKAQVMQAKFDVLQAQNQLEIYSSDLARVLGLNPHQDLAIVGEVPNLTFLSQPDFKTIIEKTPQKLTAQGQIQSSEAGVTVARSAFMPSLDINGAVGKTDSEFFPQNQRWSVGASLSWNLFDGGKDYFSQKSAFSQKLVAERNWRNAELDLFTQLKRTYRGWQEARERYEVSHAYVEAGRVRAQIGRERYNNGLSSFDEWDRIETDLISYQKDQVLRKRDRVLAEANWEKAQGIGVIN